MATVRNVHSAGSREYSQSGDDGERDAELGADRKEQLQVDVELDEELGQQRQLRLGAHVDRDEDRLQRASAVVVINPVNQGLTA
jgi:hypothetical protein